MNGSAVQSVDFSIIIPTYDRPTQLNGCLQALARLEYPRDRFEVIVVDDGSETPPEAMVASLRDGLDVMLITQTHAGAAAARNTGAARAKGTFLAFTDDDCRPAQDWLQTLAARFAMTADHAIGGRVLNALPDNPYSGATQVIIDVVYAHFNSVPGRALFLVSGNFALPADKFRAIGGFDATFPRSEDRDFCDRWLQHNYRMTYAPEALVYHAHPLTLRTFCGQHFNYGRGDFHFHRARAGRFLRRFRPDVRFYWAVFRRPFSEAGIRRTISLASFLLVWQAAKTAGFFWEGAIRVMKILIRR